MEAVRLQECRAQLAGAEAAATQLAAEARQAREEAAATVAAAAKTKAEAAAAVGEARSLSRQEGEGEGERKGGITSKTSRASALTRAVVPSCAGI